MKNLEKGKIYDVVVETKRTPKSKKTGEKIHRALYVGEDDDMLKFILKPNANRPITWLVIPDAIVKTKKIRDSIKNPF